MVQDERTLNATVKPSISTDSAFMFYIVDNKTSLAQMDQVIESMNDNLSERP